MSARWWTLVVWAGVAGSALFWGLRLGVTPLTAPPQTQVAEPGAGARGDLARLLGADAAPRSASAAAEPAADARYALVGVLSPRAPQAAREGVALIAVDGKPAKAFRVGAVVDGQNVLRSVGARGVTLGPRDGVALIALDIAPPPPAATGTLAPPAATGTMPPLSGAVPVRPGAAGPVLQQSAPTQRSPVQLPGTAPNADIRETR